MKLLLDTHVWLWSLLEPELLAAPAIGALTKPNCEIWLSPLSSWELLSALERGRIKSDRRPLEYVDSLLRGLPAREAAFTHRVVLESRRLEWKHKDPVDRFLVATARIYDLTLVTADREILRAKPCAVLAAA